MVGCSWRARVDRAGYLDTPVWSDRSGLHGRRAGSRLAGGRARLVAQPLELADDAVHGELAGAAAGLDRRLLLVGHEPDLATWVSWSLTRRRDRLLAFKKAGAALLEFPGPPEGGTGTLRWLLAARQLRALG